MPIRSIKPWPVTRLKNRENPGSRLLNGRTHQRIEQLQEQHQALQTLGEADVFKQLRCFQGCIPAEFQTASGTRKQRLQIVQLTLQAAARQMINQDHGGKIINMASQAGRRGEALVGVYCASKAAVISLTQSAGLNLIKHKINVNAIAPGVVDGEHWDGVDALFAKYENRPLGEKKRLVGQEVPYGRMATADDLTGMAVFLASHDSDYVVAQTYNVDGGNWMS